MVEPAQHPSYGPAYFLQMLATLGIWVGLSRWGGLSYQGQQYEVILLWMFLFRPLSTLVHELGHALAVRRLAGRPAEVIVGASSPAVKGRLGQVSIRFSPVPVMGSQVAGLCRYRPDGIEWRARGWISLAGPGATLLELLIMLALLPVWSQAAVVVRDVFAVGTAMLALNVVTNLVPTPLVRDRDGRVVLGRDGWNAREAFRNARSAVPALGAATGAASLPEVEAGPAAPPSLPEVDAGPDGPPAGAAPAPRRAAAAPRTLAEIWSNHEESVDQTAALPAAKSASEQLTRGDFAQRALAEIWSGQPDHAAKNRPSVGRGPASHAAAAADPVEPVEPFEPVVPLSVDARLELAESYLEAGRIAQAIPLLEVAVTALQAGDDDGDGDGDKLASARGALAKAYLAARHPRLAIALYDLLLADTSSGIFDSTRLEYRIKRAQAFRAGGEASAAIDQLESLVAELENGGDAERLTEAQVELATTYVVGHRVKDGVKAYEHALPQIERLLGTGHRKSLRVRLLLARAYQADGQTQLAIRTYRNVVSDAERALGPDDKLIRQADAGLTVLLDNQRR
jgi:tetratricopeptide (TPR) repeat protein